MVMDTIDRPGSDGRFRCEECDIWTDGEGSNVEGLCGPCYRLAYPERN